jgi:cysteine-rich repeat protein
MKSAVLLLAFAVTVAACGGSTTDAPPTANSQSITTREDTAVEIDVGAHDPEGKPLTVTATAPAHGALSQAGAVFTYTPAADFNGADATMVTVSDGHAMLTVAVTITVTPVNDPPVPGPDAIAAALNLPTSVAASALLSNDTDVDGDPLSVATVSAATHGTVALVGGTVTFTPEADFVGAAGFEYAVSDGTLRATGQVTVTVGGNNQPPVATDDTAITAEDTPLAVGVATLLANDTDPDGQLLAITAVGNATDGAVALVGGTITFTPAADFAGTAGFDYTISDGALTDTGHVTVTVTPVDDAPVATDDVATTAEDTPLALAGAALTGNDTDIDGPALTVTAVAGATHGVVVVTAGDVTFTPAANFAGAAGFDYTVSDGTRTDVGHVDVTVTPVNDPPVAIDDAATTAEDTALTIAAATLAANDTDVDGDALVVVAVGAASGGTVGLVTGTITFTPTANFAGTAGFDYTVSDGALTDTGHVAIAVTPVADPPVASDDAATTAEDTAITFAGATLVGNDTDVDSGALALTAVAGATHGTVAFNGGDPIFTPAANFAGTAGFDYTVSDGALTDTGHVVVTVTPVNDAPVAIDDTGATAVSAAATFTDAALLANDTDVDGDPLVVTGVAAAVHGTVGRSAGVTTFTPDAGFSGTGGFDYTISDGALTDTGHVSIQVGSGNTAPVAVDDPASTSEDTVLLLSAASLLANDTDANGDTLTLTAVQNPVNAIATLAAGTITITPAPDFHGTASFEYVVSDGLATDVGLVTIAVASVNDLPVAAADSATTLEDTAVTTAVLANDSGLGDGGLIVTITAPPAHGAAVVNADRTITYTPAANFNGGDAYSYQVADVDGDAAIATVTLTITAVADAPVVAAQAVATAFDTPVTIALTAIDVDSPAVTFAIGAAPAHGALGALTPTGAFTATVLYTPTTGYAGLDAFTVTASDGALTSPAAAITITIAPGPMCGNGIIEAGEQCDDQGTAAGDGCSPTCAQEPGWTCTGAPSACDEICGDTLVVGGEGCDDGNAIDTDGCTTKCVAGHVCDSGAVAGGDAFATDPATGTCYVSFTAEPTTWSDAEAACLALRGHLVTITSAGEQARVHGIQLGTPWIGAVDDANDTDAVFDWVTPEPWGFAAFAPGEPDDDVAFGGNGECLAIVAADGGWGDTNCTFVGYTDGRICEFEAEPCGDGIIQPGEACDDGNRITGDGCSATCQVEPGATCTGIAPTTCGKLVINELDYDQPGAENSNGLFEFVEILNVGTAPVDLTGVALVLINGGTTTPSEYFFDGSTSAASVSKRIVLTAASVPGNTLPVGGMIVVAPAGQFTAPGFPAGVFKITVAPPVAGWLQNGSPDAIALMALGAAPVVIDAFSYEGTTAPAAIVGLTGTWPVTEGTGHPTGDNQAAGGMSRLPNGKDLGNNATDFALRPVTPGLPN